MNLPLKDCNLELWPSMIMGVVDLTTEKLTPEDLHARATSFSQYGASFIEFGCSGDLPEEEESKALVQALESVKDVADLIPAVYTSSSTIMEAVVKAGAQIIIDPLALRGKGAMEAAVDLKVPVCLCFDKARVFNEETDLDPCALVSDFFYERIDSCIEAGIDHNHLLLEPQLGGQPSLVYRLKMQGRLKTLQSFGLPLTCEVPRVFPQADEFLEKNSSAAIALSLFMQQQGIHILRTKNVYDLAIALETSQALNASARPFKLIRAVKNTLHSFTHA